MIKQEYTIRQQENAIVDGIITEAPHIVYDQKDRSAVFGWMHIRGGNGIEYEVIISEDILFQYCEEHKEELSVGKKVRLRGMLSKGEGMDYMHLDNYGEIILCKEELTEDNKE